MTPSLKRPAKYLAIVALLSIQGCTWADGFRLDWARKHEPHIVVHLVSAQVAAVGRERKLILTPKQRATLGKFTKKVPSELGVESLGEPDCSCHISSALWTATSEVTIWLDRLARDPDGSKFYYEVRRKQGHYTANADGALFHAGLPVSWRDFEAAVLNKKDGETIQLSLPPTQPKELRKRIRRLQAKAHFNYRL